MSDKHEKHIQLHSMWEKDETFQVDRTYVSFADNITHTCHSLGTITDSLTWKKVSNRNPPSFLIQGY